MTRCVFSEVVRPRVICHVRGGESAGNEPLMLYSEKPGVLTLDTRDGPPEEFLFDGIVSDKTSTSEMYELEMEPSISMLFQGENSAVLAFGHAGLGKTHTLFGLDTTDGLVQLAAKKILRIIKDEPDFALAVAFYDYSNDEIFDVLLQFEDFPTETGAASAESESSPSGFDLRDQTEIEDHEGFRVPSYEVFESLLRRRESWRATRITESNNSWPWLHSSIVLILRHIDPETGSITRPALHIIDLASLDQSRIGKCVVNSDSSASHPNWASINLAAELNKYIDGGIKKDSDGNAIITRVLDEILDDATVIITCLSLLQYKDQTIHALRLGERLLQTPKEEASPVTLQPHVVGPQMRRYTRRKESHIRVPKPRSSSSAASELEIREKPEAEDLKPVKPKTISAKPKTQSTTTSCKTQSTVSKTSSGNTIEAVISNSAEPIQLNCKDEKLASESKAVGPGPSKHIQQQVSTIGMPLETSIALEVELIPFLALSCVSDVNSTAEAEIARRDQKIAQLERELLALKVNDLKMRHNEESKQFQFENALLGLGRKVSEIERVNGALQRNMAALQDSVVEKTSTITRLQQTLQNQQDMVANGTHGFENKLKELQQKLVDLEAQQGTERGD